MVNQLKSMKINRPRHFKYYLIDRLSHLKYLNNYNNILQSF